MRFFGFNRKKHVLFRDMLHELEYIIVSAYEQNVLNLICLSWCIFWHVSFIE